MLLPKRLRVIVSPILKRCRGTREACLIILEREKINIYSPLGFGVAGPEHWLLLWFPSLRLQAQFNFPAIYICILPLAELDLEISIGLWNVSAAYRNALVNLADMSDRRGRVSGKLDSNSLEMWYPSLYHDPVTGTHPDIFFKKLRVKLSADTALCSSFLHFHFTLSVNIYSSMPNSKEVPCVPPGIFGFHSVLYRWKWASNPGLHVLTVQFLEETDSLGNW